MGSEKLPQYLSDARKWRKDLASPLRDPSSTQDEKDRSLNDLQTLRGILRDDPDYRQAIRIVSEIRNERQPVLPTQEAVGNAEERIENVLAGIGNSAPKCVALLCLVEGGRSATPKEVQREFVSVTDNSWNTIHPSTIMGWTRDSFVPRGIMDETTHATTSAGKEYAVPAAKFLTKEASTLSFSLGEVFSQAHKSERSQHRTPYTIFRMFELMGEADAETGLRATDFATKIGVSLPPIGRHLFDLQKLGLVKYSSVNSESTEGKYTYTLVGNLNMAPPYVRGLTTRYVLQALQQPSILAANEGAFDVTAIHEKAAELGAQVREREGTGLILAELAKQGILQAGEFENGKNQSKALLTPEGKEFVARIIDPLRIGMTDSPEGKKLRQEWDQIQWERYAADAVEIHKERPGYAEPLPVEEVYQMVLKTVTEHPGLRTNQLNELIHRKNVNPLLTRLVTEGRIKRIHSGKGTYWYPAESPDVRQAG